MEMNFTIDRGFGTAASVVLSVEMILALIANGIVLLITITQRKSWKQFINNILHFSHTGFFCDGSTVHAFLYHCISCLWVILW